MKTDQTLRESALALAKQVHEHCADGYFTTTTGEAK